MLTILLPAYNGATFINECIESILIQDFKDFELLIIDDCSTDDTIGIINSIRDERIRIIKNGKNVGLAKSLNIGIRESSFDLIVRIDQDDVMFSDRLSKTVEEFQNNSYSALVFSSADIINSVGAKIGFFRLSKNKRRLRFFLIFINPFIHSSASFKKNHSSSLFEYDISSKYSPPEDFELWSRLILLEKADFKVIDKALVKYRFTTDSYSRTNSDLNQHAGNICERNIIKLTDGMYSESFVSNISQRLYSNNSYSRINYLSLLKFLFRMNRSVNHDFKISDLIFIIEIFLRLVFSSKLKFSINRVIRFSNLIRYR
jgi:glycosyltransferase involved in cell wall biosynthesis